MKIEFIDNQEKKLGEILASEIGKSLDTRVAVAFVSNSGLKSLEEEFLIGLADGNKAEFLVGLDFATTDPKALHTLHNWAKKYSGFKFYVLPPNSGSIYHPKMYLLETIDSGTVVVGSSNLTQAGLFKNAEANVLVWGDKKSSVFIDAQESFIRLKFDNRHIPDENFILSYEETANRIRKSRKNYKKSEIELWKRKIEKESEELPKPKLTSSDLVGWLKLVYDVLPNGDFTNDEVYAYEEEFQSRYPDNQNVKQKIRQQLQFLRDRGLIEHLETGKWRKD